MPRLSLTRVTHVKGIKMRKRPPIIEWHVAESEAEWAELQARPTATSQPVWRHGWGYLLILVLTMGMGGWWWRTAPAEQASIPPV